jgi:hypothetical protein
MSVNGYQQRRAEHPDDIWCWDFVSEADTTGQGDNVLIVAHKLKRQS